MADYYLSSAGQVLQWLQLRAKLTFSNKTMKLFYTKSSPYAACVRATIAELKAEKQVEYCECHPFDNQEEFLAVNPLGKVPCLIADGEAILDSEVICDYLDANISGGRLFENIYADWRLKTYYSLCSGLIDSSVDLRIEAIRSQEGIKSDFWWHRYTSAIERTLIEVEKRLELLPDNFTIIHIGLFCALSYLDFRHPEIKWRDGKKKLAAFFDSLKHRECFSAAVYTN